MELHELTDFQPGGRAPRPDSRRSAILSFRVAATGSRGTEEGPMAGKEENADEDATGARLRFLDEEGMGA